MAKANKEKWNRGLARTRQGLMGKLSGLFSGKSRVDENVLDDLEETLIESDLGVDLSLDLVEKLRSHLAKTGETSRQAVVDFLKDHFRQAMGDSLDEEIQYSGKPHVILVVGVNGTGKTTTIGKLAHRFRNEGRKVLLAGADTFRAAAGEQLEVWAKRSHSDIIRQPTGADPASVAFDALDAAIARNVDILLIDTAGRLQNKSHLMEELKKIHRVIKKRMDTAPHQVLLVLDGTTGQNGLQQARLFTEAVGVTDVALTKIDGTARGGVVLAIHRELGLPIRWAGLGEGLDDLTPFDVDAFIEGLFE